jgi:probable HAF family extracellular repeat protein
VSPKAQAFSGCGNREEQRRETLHYRQINTLKTKLNFLLRTAFSVLSFMLFAAGVAPSAPAASFQGLGDLPGGTFGSWAYSVSVDGKVVVGNSRSTNGTEAFRWTVDTGMVGLGDLPGGVFYSEATGVSADGTVVVGRGSSSFGAEAFRWTQATGMVGLGDLPGGNFSSAANAVSADGQVVVGFGSSTLSGTRYEAFRWTQATGMEPLGDLPDGKFHSEAYAVSADGQAVVGFGYSTFSGIFPEAFRWTRATGMVGLGDFPGGWTNSTAYGVSADGSVVIGRAYPGSFGFDGTHEAYSWTAQSGLLHLGFAPGDQDSVAWAASADGSTIVGDNLSRAIIWDSRHGMRRLREALITDYGLDLTGWELTSARGISPDGNMIVGSGINPAGQYEAWIANLKPPCLTISRAANRVILLWETNASGFVLEQTSSLSASSVWNVVSAPAVVLGDQYVVTNSVTQSPGFFRLRKP